jgi:hypothetical protein
LDLPSILIATQKVKEGNIMAQDDDLRDDTTGQEYGESDRLPETRRDEPTEADDRDADMSQQDMDEEMDDSM